VWLMKAGAGWTKSDVVESTAGGSGGGGRDFSCLEYKHSFTLSRIPHFSPS